MSRMKNKSGGLVYSTDGGKFCPGCCRPIAECVCKKKHPTVSDGVVRIRRETKGRKGQGVTVITGVPLAGDDLKAFAKTLKQQCGSGGTVKDGVIEIQGEHRETLIVTLKKKGWVVKG